MRQTPHTMPSSSRKSPSTRLVVLVCACLTAGLAGPWPMASAQTTVPASRPALVVDSGFPGGNGIVEAIDGDTITLHQDLRDTTTPWFYWYVRVRNAAGRSLTFRFTQSRAIGVRGPAVSLDGGATWNWAGADSVDGNGFRYAVPATADEARFAFTVPYTEANLRQFLDLYRNHKALDIDTLCTSHKGHRVELLRLGPLDGKPAHRVLLTARHHCCETMASFVLEGVIDAVLTDTDTGPWLRDNVEFLIVPFMDKDGVEDGDQGKNRRPRDHNRDYAGESLYPEVAALRRRVPDWSGGRLCIALDLHCPYISGPQNEVIYFVGLPDNHLWDNVTRFSTILEETRRGSLPFHTKDNLPFGKAWNTNRNYADGMSFARWAAALPDIRVASTIETPYATASGRPVTPENARAFGRDLAWAIRKYLKQVDD